MEGEKQSDLEEKESKIWCRICNINVPGATKIDSKGSKQHLKSITHKKSLKSKLGDQPIQKTHIEERLCQICKVYGESKSHPYLDSTNAQFSDEDEEYCLPPPFIDSPDFNKLHRTPFITLKGGKLKYAPDNLEVVLDKYCHGDPKDRLPNIDINSSSEEVRSFSSAQSLLMKAHTNRDIYWSALSIEGLIEDPSWWPGDLERRVPGYTQIIIGSGPTDIGIHQDLYSGNVFIPVNTYITVAHGEKLVLMLPPTTNVNDLMLLIKKDTSKRGKFPKSPSQELIQRIHEAGGYFFKVRAAKRKSKTDAVTLFVPKGWHHWLLGLSDWAVIFGASTFADGDEDPHNPNKT